MDIYIDDLELAPILKKIPPDIDKWPYDVARGFVLLHLSKYRSALANFRNQFQLGDRNQAEVHDQFVLNMADEQCNKSIVEICRTFGVTKRFFRYSVANDADVLKVTLPVYIAYEMFPITRDGFYIKVDERTTLDTVEDAYFYIKNELERLWKLASKTPSKARYGLKIRDRQPKNIKAKIALYILVQNVVSENKKEYEQASKDKQAVKYSEKALVKNALLYAAEEYSNNYNLKENVNDLFDTIKRRYYTVTQYYSLPK